MSRYGPEQQPRYLRSRVRPELGPEAARVFNIFTQSKRQIGAMQRNGQDVPVELIGNRIKADYLLSQHVQGWQSHFGFVRGQELTPELLEEKVVSYSTSIPPKAE